ncbi:MAG: SDR family oxidoreductase [Deltaproteobacteria bacterium]|nr:SDR family oxidoreductase [Deltaproteobacteria bacterium]
MRVAVTGANGMLGGEAVAQLAGRHEVLALGLGPGRPPAPDGTYRWLEADLGDGQSVEQALHEFGAQAVLHAGAVTDVDGCEKEPLTAWNVNLGGTVQVARSCRALGARLLYVSTDYVFDGASGPYGEDDIPNARGVYAQSKLAGEWAALSIAPDCAVARVAVVYSGRATARSTFATQVVEKLTRGEVVKAFDDQFTTTTLAASGAAMCLELLLEHGYRGVLHVSDATVMDRVDFANRVARRFGLKGEIVPVKTASVKLLAPRPLRGGLRVGRAANMLGNRPLSIDAALDRFLDEWARRTAR